MKTLSLTELLSPLGPASGAERAAPLSKGKDAPEGAETFAGYLDEAQGAEPAGVIAVPAGSGQAPLARAMPTGGELAQAASGMGTSAVSQEVVTAQAGQWGLAAGMEPALAAETAPLEAHLSHRLSALYRKGSCAPVAGGEPAKISSAEKTPAAAPPAAVPPAALPPQEGQAKRKDEGPEAALAGESIPEQTPAPVISAAGNPVAAAPPAAAAFAAHVTEVAEEDEGLAAPATDPALGAAGADEARPAPRTGIATAAQEIAFPRAESLPQARLPVEGAAVAPLGELEPRRAAAQAPAPAVPPPLSEQLASPPAAQTGSAAAGPEVVSQSHPPARQALAGNSVSPSSGKQTEPAVALGQSNAAVAEMAYSVSVSPAAPGAFAVQGPARRPEAVALPVASASESSAPLAPQAGPNPAVAAAPEGKAVPAAPAPPPREAASSGGKVDAADRSTTELRAEPKGVTPKQPEAAEVPPLANGRANTVPQGVAPYEPVGEALAASGQTVAVVRPLVPAQEARSEPRAAARRSLRDTDEGRVQSRETTPAFRAAAAEPAQARAEGGLDAIPSATSDAALPAAFAGEALPEQFGFAPERPAAALRLEAAGAGHAPAGAQRAGGEADIARQLASALPGATDGPVEISLNPEELGKVRLAMHTQDGAITVSVQAERPETLDLMRRNIDSLARDFREMGYAQISFEFGDRPAQHQGARSETPQAPPREQEPPVLFQPASLAIQPRLHEPAAGLDLRM